MSQILAWRSDFDGKLFESKAKYVAHLKKLAKVRRLNRAAEQIVKQHYVIQDAIGQVASWHDLELFIKENWDSYFFPNGLRRTWKHKQGSRKQTLIDVSVYNVRFVNKLSNSHSCPRGGQENFLCIPDIPRSYPGWHGRIKIKIQTGKTASGRFEDGFGNAYFDETVIKTSSGGGGLSKTGETVYDYELFLWAADFPVMWENHTRLQTLVKINSEREKAWKAVGGPEFVSKVSSVPEDWQVPDPFTPL